MRKTAISCVRYRRPRRPWWRRKRWWAAFCIYGLGLSFVLGHMSDRRWGRNPSTEAGGVETLASAPDIQPMSRAFATPAFPSWAGGKEGLVQGWRPTPDSTFPPRNLGRANQGSSTVSATWLIRPETPRELEREQGPGFRDVKMVTFEMPDLKNAAAR